MKQLDEYRTLIFDCDGVILDSNKVKTDAFYKTTLQYGASAAAALVKYHTENGGVSRYLKFNYFFSEILKRLPNDGEIDSVLDAFSVEVWEGLNGCAVTEGLTELRSLTPKANWIVVSGGDELELRRLFQQRNLSYYFDGNIYGSPDPKDWILKRELNSGLIKKPALFMGDSKLDHEAANRAGLDFLFISAWTEFKNWKEYCVQENVVVAPNVNALITGSLN